MGLPLTICEISFGGGVQRCSICFVFSLNIKINDINVIKCHYLLLYIANWLYTVRAVIWPKAVFQLNLTLWQDNLCVILLFLSWTSKDTIVLIICSLTLYCSFSSRPFSRIHLIWKAPVSEGVPAIVCLIKERKIVLKMQGDIAVITFLFMLNDLSSECRQNCRVPRI